MPRSQNKLVGYSRAGDAFHYRWAARRCLRLIYPKSQLRHIIIEGSKDSALAGEYVIDVAEYSDSDRNGIQEITYYQLKHTTVRKEQPFNLSDLKDTISGFADRYRAFLNRNDPTRNFSIVTFTIVTNRAIADNFKRDINAIAKGDKVNARFKATFKKYTKLNEKNLAEFCALLKFVDGEGDYEAQRYELHAEISQLLAGAVDSPQIDSVVALVQDKVLPNSDGRIEREDILKRFGVTSERDLYPAPLELESLDTVIPRKQHQELLNSIVNSSVPVIIHAAGGVGKSVFARQITESLPKGSLGIVYDCFGGGRYRNRSEPRHRHRDALVQISNELASQGLCSPLIALPTDLDDEIMRAFLIRLEIAVTLLRKADKNAVLAILIDAADNAEMAAQEFSQSCFVHELIREPMPKGCRVVALCRTERTNLLRPPANVLRLELQPFSAEETLMHLRNRFSQATSADGLEFHRLTNNGNPRVQANALGLGLPTIAATLDSIGPLGTTVEKQIEAQLDSAIALIKDRLPLDYQEHIDAICLGLATLPPFIPLSVLATAADVDEATVVSFVADLGRPLWLSDTSVQFRDEPTETWFRGKFSATSDQVNAYISRLEPLAQKFPYVAETLPSLYLNAGRYRELIDLAISDNFLPKDNPIDERNVRVYRLQFAFKAALKAEEYADATKLALRAGEEVAGDKRQLEILRKNIDLIAPLQYEQKVQDLAFRRSLRGDWDGSENVYAAALLSSVEDFKGEARGYLRAANNWLHLYFEKRKEEKTNHFDDKLTDDDIVELAFSQFNLHGTKKLVDFILSWKPPEVIYRISKKFFRRLIDANSFVAIEEILHLDLHKQHIGSQYLIIAIAHELLDVRRLPDRKATRICLDLLASNRTRIAKPVYSYKDTTLSAIVSFIEASAANKHSKEKILRVLNHYIPVRASRSVSSDFQTEERDTYLRALALRCVLENKLEPDLDMLLPKEFIEKKTKKKKTYSYDQELREFKERVGGLLPWYIIRARILVNGINDLFQLVVDADEKSKKARAQRYRDSDSMPYEISHVLVEVLTLYRFASPTDAEKFFTLYLKDNKQVWIQDRLKSVRSAFRSDHLSGIRRQLEVSTNAFIASLKSEDPETRAEWYTDLARAVFSVSREDAATYFNYAIEAVSKFGDELVERWEAVAALAKRSAEDGYSSPEMAYRFIRCAELIGDNVAREKHWNRSGAVRACVQLSPVSALASLSRWRDRDVGWFGRQVVSLADELVTANIISPAVGWSLSVFFEEYGLDDFAALCIEKESSAARRQYVLDTVVRDLRINETTEQSWQTLHKVARQHTINNADLDDVLTFYIANPEKKDREPSFPIGNSKNKEESKPVERVYILDDLDLATSTGISEAITRRDKASTKFRSHEAFWQEVFKRVNEHDAVKFLKALVIAEHADRFDVQTALSSLPEDWRQKVSIKRNWGNILELIAQRFALEFTSRWSLEYFLEKIEGNEEVMPHLRQGILKGLSSNIDLVNASTFFGFAEIVSPFITSQQANNLLDFALTRFELHVDDDYADGPWKDWLNPPSDITTALAGFIWSALGSPRAEIRWRAAHCVRRLASLGCEAEINALVKWMERDRVDAFGSQKYPFYNLHARQYLLIALARVSIDNPEILKRYSATFSQLALSAMPHILIQKFSAQVALNIENAFPKTYQKNVVKQLQQVGISQLPVRKLDKYNEKVESYWHARGEVRKNIKFYHGYDFDRYWYEPLGDVFGISAKQVEELATEIILDEWHVNEDGSFNSDPRVGLWSSTRNERETWHDHGSYPRTDNYSFYLSYHSMLTIASKLLQKMPVVKKRDWYEDEDQWIEWLHRHLLTRNDGRWLADRRDPAPLLRPNWIRQAKAENWRSEITTDDFLDTILFERQGETWLNVSGSWQEGYSERVEDLYVSTALVSPPASQSLLNALTTCSDPNDFKLPNYEENEMEFDLAPFILKGWIWRGYTGKRLDEYDPFAGEIAFPPYQVSDVIVEQLGMSVDTEQREWFLPSSDKASLICELWSINKPRPDEDPLRRGERLSASLDFLKKLCLIQKCQIIFNIQISRRFHYGSHARNEGDNGYNPPHSKIYILSADGKLRDTETHYQIR